MTVAGGNFEGCPSFKGKAGASSARIHYSLEQRLNGLLVGFDDINTYGDTVYLSDGGEGDGYSADSPIGSLDQAYMLLCEDGGRIVLVGRYTLGENFIAFPIDERITITGRFGENNYSGELYLGSGQRYDLNGPTTFENIAITVNNGGYFFIVGNYNPIEIGEGVVCTGFGGTLVTNSFTVLGGMNSTKAPAVIRDSDASITIRSGSGILVAGMNRYYADAHSRSATINIYGGNIVTLYGGNINGGTGGDVDVNIYGGRFTGNLSFAYGASGKITVRITGGDFSSVKSLSANKALSSKLYITDELKKSLLSKITGFNLSFDVGDIDLDESVTNRDITLLVRYLSGFGDGVAYDLADVTGDGRINNRDVIALIIKLS